MQTRIGDSGALKPDFTPIIGIMYAAERDEHYIQ